MKVVVTSAKPGADQRHDLDSRAAIHDLVVGFYREIVFDELLEPVFGEVAEVDWTLHIPKLIDYWCRVLLRQPGCSACLGMNEDKIPAGKYCISTSNRNFEGRQGPNARTLLASPLTAAVAAITGEVADIREFI